MSPTLLKRLITKHGRPLTATMAASEVPGMTIYDMRDTDTGEDDKIAVPDSISEAMLEDALDNLIENMI